MIRRLPRWVEAGAFALAFAAGSVNAIGLLGFSHQAVSHLSGTSTLLGLALAQVNWASGIHLLLVILSFIFGAVFSGVLIDSSALQSGRRYGVALLVETVLLLLAMLALHYNSVSGHYLASAACGLQNAMVTTFSGAIIRTTHVTGLFTDLGLMLGARLRGQALDRRKLVLFLLLIGGFIGGGGIGARAFAALHFQALLLPAALTAVMALLYQRYLRRA